MGSDERAHWPALDVLDDPWRRWAERLSPDAAQAWLDFAKRTPIHPRRAAAACHVLEHPEHQRFRRYCPLCGYPKEADDA